MRVWVFLIVLLSSRAWAQSAEDKAASDALFDEGKRLIIAADYAHACAKFEASLKLVARIGAKLNLADCYEKAGRTASAWAEFREAAALAARANDDARSSFANQRAAALEPYLAKLAIRVAPEDRIAGMTITRDGALVPEAVFETHVPVDPGEHTIQASAPGFQSWEQKITVVREKEHTIEVPRLLPAPEAPRAAPAPEPSAASPATPPATSHRKLAAYIVGGAGVAALGATGILASAARSKWQSASPHCNAQDHCDAKGLSLNRDARTLGNAATVTFIAGTAAIAAGVVLYLTAPGRSRERAVAIAPVVAPGFVGVVYEGGL
jgi:hypothetical protein